MCVAAKGWRQEACLDRAGQKRKKVVRTYSLLLLTPYSLLLTPYSLLLLTPYSLLLTPYSLLLLTPYSLLLPTQMVAFGA